MGVNTTISERLARRPKTVPPASKNDLVIEAICIIGLLLNIVFVIYGFINLHGKNILRHLDLSGGIDADGSKWILLLFFFICNVILYTLLTITSRYPYVFNYPVIVTEENAPILYRLIRNMLRCNKMIIVWMTTIMAWTFIEVLPYNPGQSTSGSLFLIIFGIAFTIATGYYIIKILVGKFSHNTLPQKKDTKYPHLPHQPGERPRFNHACTRPTIYADTIFDRGGAFDARRWPTAGGHALTPQNWFLETVPPDNLLDICRLHQHGAFRQFHNNRSLLFRLATRPSL